MNWNNIRYFLAVARTGKVSTAAKRLSVDHTTVSRRISSLEGELGESLFNRLPRGYQLTEAGERLLPFAEQMESQSLALRADISGKTTLTTGTVRVASPEGLGSQFICNHLNSFYARHPEIELELVAEMRAISLSKREADIALTLTPPRRGRLKVVKAASYRLKLYASTGYISKQRPIVRPIDLKGHPFIAYINDLQPYPELNQLEDRLPDPRVIFRCTNVTGQINAVINGMGLALLPAFMADEVATLVPLFPDQIFQDRDLWLIVHEDLRPIARVDAVYSYLRDLFSQQKQKLLGL